MKKTSLITVAFLLSQYLLWAGKIPNISVADLNLQSIRVKWQSLM